MVGLPNGACSPSVFQCQRLFRETQRVRVPRETALGPAMACGPERHTRGAREAWVRAVRASPPLPASLRSQGVLRRGQTPRGPLGPARLRAHRMRPVPAPNSMTAPSLMVTASKLCLLDLHLRPQTVTCHLRVLGWDRPPDQLLGELTSPSYPGYQRSEGMTEAADGRARPRPRPAGSRSASPARALAGSRAGRAPGSPALAPGPTASPVAGPRRSPVCTRGVAPSPPAR